MAKDNILKCKSAQSLIILGLLLLFCSFPLTAEDDLLLKGVQIGPYAVGQMNESQVRELLVRESEILRERTITLELLPEKRELGQLTAAQCGIELDTQRIWQEAYELGRQGNWWQRWRTRWQVRRKGRVIPLYLKLEEQTAKNTLQAATAQLTVPAQNARLLVTPKDSIEILPEVPGRTVDLEALLADLARDAAVLTNTSIRLSVMSKELAPEITAATLTGYKITGLVTSFATSYNTQKINRSRNIILAAGALDGIILAPGQVFSFNQTVGPRTKERGYDEADVILNNQLVPDIGGGVCQVSTTFYNAVLRAQLDILERHPHSLLIRYVEPGLDAAVAYGSKDFSFRNNSSGHLLIKFSARYGTVTCKVFGLAEEKKRIVLKSIKEREIPPKTIYRNDPTVPQGQYILEKSGSPGIYIRVERYVYDKNGQLLSRTTVSRDYYPPVERIIRSSTDPSQLSPDMSNYHEL